MANSISLSTDMKTLYLFDGSGTSFTPPFSLAGNGVYITSIMGDVHVVAATRPLPNGADECDIASKSQWQAAFHANTNQLVMIGSDDMESGFTADFKKSDLSKGNVVNLRLDNSGTKILIRTS